MAVDPKLDPANYLPMTPAQVSARGWDHADVVFVTGDAYVDHPSFAMAVLGRLMEAQGFRVAILSQPDWRSCQPWRQFGRPRLCFAISAGNMDSMVNHYTANRKVRNDDAYSAGGGIGQRPDRATAVYCQRAREAFKGVPIVAGGVEASLRRLAHYDYWSDKVRRSILLDSKADLLVFGMGERPLLEILRRLAAGKRPADCRDLRGVAYRLGASEVPPPGQPFHLPDSIELPSYEEVAADRRRFAEMTRIAHLETNPYNARRLVQRHGPEAVVINPPALPLSPEEMDRVYCLPFMRHPHPDYGGRTIPAFEVVKDSVQIMRGCFGGCTFCSITAHEGRIIQSRSERSILDELRRLAQDRDFKGTVSDLGGPTANMYRMNCKRPEVREKCRRLSCLHPAVCKLLDTDHGPLVRLLRAARALDGIKNVLVASGVRMDLALQSPAYLRELVRHHVGGHLKVAPEHSHPEVLRRMKKPGIETFEAFARCFERLSRESGKEQYLVPYFIAGHPGCGLAEMVALAQYLKRTGYRPEQVQDFYPTPFDIATCMYYTGIDPMTGEEVYMARGARERRLQRALLQFFMPERYFDVREALVEAGRQDLIGDGPECLIPAKPPPGAGRQRAATKLRGDRALKPSKGRSRPSPAGAPGMGYRPHRKTARRRRRP